MVDYKCTSENPICVKSDGDEPDLHSPGDKCIDKVKHVYSTNNDFDNNNTVFINVDMHTADQLGLKSSGINLKFLWIPESSSYTIIKINTDTGVVVGCYKMKPGSYSAGYYTSISVDMDGSLWITNSPDSYQRGIITHIGLEENNQCKDRNGNGKIETLTGLNDLKAWPDDRGTRGVATAADECIVHFLNVTSTWSLHINVNQDNDVWVSEEYGLNFYVVKGGRYDIAGSGIITKTYRTDAWGGSRLGLIDDHGVVWAVHHGLMRWDPKQPVNGTNGAPGGLNVGPPSPGKT